MKKLLVLAIAGVSLLTIAFAQNQNDLRAELSPLAFLVDSCWAGKFPDNKRTDTHCYETVFDGMHIRDRHIVLGGKDPYRGETIYSWNKEKNVIGFVYWNSLGGVSTGTVVALHSQITFPDESYDGPNGERITISSAWENITDDGYDSRIAETSAGGSSSVSKMRFERRPFRKL